MGAAAVKIETPWLNYDEAAAYLRMKRATLKNMVSAREIPVYGSPRRRVFRRDMLDLWLRDRAAAMREWSAQTRGLTMLAAIEAPAAAGVYLLQGASGFVKIGRAKNIAKRLQALQAAHPVPLRLLAILSENPDDEKTHHQRWAHLRRAGEWFEPDAELCTYVWDLRGLR